MSEVTPESASTVIVPAGLQFEPLAGSSSGEARNRRRFHVKGSSLSSTQLLYLEDELPISIAETSEAVEGQVVGETKSRVDMLMSDPNWRSSEP